MFILPLSYVIHQERFCYQYKFVETNQYSPKIAIKCVIQTWKHESLSNKISFLPKKIECTHTKQKSCRFENFFDTRKGEKVNNEMLKWF